MYNVILLDSNNAEKVKINLAEDILISIPEKDDTVKFHIDGRILIKPSADINFSHAEQISGFTPTIREMTSKLNLKIFIPYGNFLLFSIPRDITFFDIFPKYSTESGFIINKNFDLGFASCEIFADKTNPNFIKYDISSIKFRLESHVCRKENPQMLLKKSRDSIFELQVSKNCANGLTSGKIYLIPNNEIFHGMKSIDK